MSGPMKTRLWYAAMNDLCALSSVNEESLAWVMQMQGALLVDVGLDSNTLLGCAELGERIRLMKDAAMTKLLLDSRRSENLVFVFGENKAPALFLHAMKIDQSWRLRMVVRQGDLYSFCPAMGGLDINFVGINMEAWPLGGKLREDNSITAFTLMDYALTAFSRMRDYKMKVFQHRAGCINFTDINPAS
ncbi:MAG: hypothetical protein A2342_02485 [Gallionellales bacterium RIFOXYB12_FULL_54_9]|nr:MAG: hypothetical protein A2342_02485 [Gallionellales bacterium RIFOXYB12_FULL_54_9]